MDSEDERDMKSQHDKSKSLAIEGYYARNGLELRPYEGDEAGTSGLFDQEEIRTDVAYYRLLRLLETMAGFHKGYTDLSGRHRQRYESIRLRYFRFARGLLTIYKLPSNDRELDIQLYLARWNAHRAMSSGELMQHIASVSRAIELSPDPKLQTLLLTGLPPEILYMIMDFEDKSIARSFGATCRRFHTISRSYIFRERELKLDHGEIDWVRSDALSEEDKRRYHSKLLMRARKSFLWHAKFLQEHEDVQKSVTRLVVRKDWSRRSFRYSSVYDNEDNVRKFYTPLYKAVCHTIPYLGSLRYLILSGWKLTSILLGQLQFLPQLHTLEMDQCKLIAPLSHPLPQLPSVLNLSYTFHEDAHFASWIVMHICPNLETLSVSITNELHNSDPDLPVENFVDEFNPFMTLRKYYISSISVSAVPRLTSWIRTARGQSPDRKIPLTHFKIDVNGGIKKDVILDLLDALKGSSIESLILDGIRYAKLDLLDKIAQALPNLLDLVLIYRDSDRQLRPEFIEWPHASWEYASHFSSFKRLQYIGWNCRRFSPTFTPVSMLRFEDNDFTDSTLDDRESDRDYPPDEERLLAKCLWSYCPTLEYMLITSEYPASLYRRNDKDGLVQFESVIDQGAFRRNPNMGWPPCNPRKQD